MFHRVSFFNTKLAERICKVVTLWVMPCSSLKDLCFLNLLYAFSLRTEYREPNKENELCEQNCLFSSLFSHEHMVLY